MPQALNSNPQPAQPPLVQQQAVPTPALGRSPAPAPAPTHAGRTAHTPWQVDDEEKYEVDFLMKGRDYPDEAAQAPDTAELAAYTKTGMCVG